MDRAQQEYVGQLAERLCEALEEKHQLLCPNIPWEIFLSICNLFKVIVPIREEGSKAEQELAQATQNRIFEILDNWFAGVEKLSPEILKEFHERDFVIKFYEGFVLSPQKVISISQEQ